VRQIAIDRRSLVALAIFPSLALGLLDDLYLGPLYQRGDMWFWAADFAQFVIVPALVVFLLIKIGSITPRNYGFRPFALDTHTVDIVGLCLFMCVVYWLSYEPVKRIASSFLSPYTGTFDYNSSLPQSPWMRIPLVLYFSLTAAFVEEAVYRGLPWLYFSLFNPGRRKVAGYVVSTSLLFSAIHSEQGLPGMLAALSLGVVAAMMYAKIQNLWPFVAAHFVTDLISFW
jgi:membrane protease YdiL (CAAX protease family)